MELDQNNGIPLYLQLLSQIKDLITNGQLQPGELLPSEAELCQAHNISRTTVRQAFAACEQDGLICRIRGKGSFVSSPIVHRSLNDLYSFSGEIENAHLTSGSTVLSFKTESASELIRNRLGFNSPEDFRVHNIVRMRSVSEIPFSIETVFIPFDICPVLNKELLTGRSLYNVLYKYENIIPTRASEVYFATFIKKSDATILRCKTGIPAFRVERITYDILGRAFEFASILVRGDRCRYEIELKASGIGKTVSFLRQIDGQTRN
ncbi:MAG: GntR family transcriptional regulator [Flexilinea sp.]